VCQDEVGRVGLILMGNVFHPAHLRSAPVGRSRTPETLAPPAALSALPAAGAGPFQALSLPRTPGAHPG
jgi:hypothetical protein